METPAPSGERFVTIEEMCVVVASSLTEAERAATNDDQIYGFVQAFHHTNADPLFVYDQSTLVKAANTARVLAAFRPRVAARIAAAAAAHERHRTTHQRECPYQPGGDRYTDVDGGYRCITCGYVVPAE